MSFPKYWRSGERTYIRTPFEPRFIAAIKDMIPYHARGYEPSTRVWNCKKEFEDALLDAAHEYFGGLEEIPAPPSNRDRVVDEPQKTGIVHDPRVAFVNLLSDDALKKAYRAAVAELHPDKGGKHEDMAALNEALAGINRLRASR